jgi:hypothetical protein
MTRPDIGENNPAQEISAEILENSQGFLRRSAKLISESPATFAKKTSCKQGQGRTESWKAPSNSEVKLRQSRLLRFVACRGEEGSSQFRISGLGFFGLSLLNSPATKFFYFVARTRRRLTMRPCPRRSQIPRRAARRRSQPRTGAWCWRRSKATLLKRPPRCRSYAALTGIRSTLLCGARAAVRMTRRI